MPSNVHRPTRELVRLTGPISTVAVPETEPQAAVMVTLPAEPPAVNVLLAPVVALNDPLAGVNDQVMIGCGLSAVPNTSSIVAVKVLVPLPVCKAAVAGVSLREYGAVEGGQSAEPGMTSKAVVVGSPGLDQPTARLSPPPPSFCLASM